MSGAAVSEIITWDDFVKVDIRVGTVVRVEDFPEARRPAYKLWVDLGELGVKKSSAQITALYSKEELVGTQVVCVCNFAVKQVGPMRSEVLVTGFLDEEGRVVLARPGGRVRNGSRLV